MEDRTDITVPLPGDLNDAIEAELEYGDAKAEWVREAIRQRLAAEDRIDEETDGGRDAITADWTGFFSGCSRGVRCISAPGGLSRFHTLTRRAGGV